MTKILVLVLLLLSAVCSSLPLSWQMDTDAGSSGSGSGSGSGWPYHYGEDRFRQMPCSGQQGRSFRVLERFTNELIVDAGVGNYRVAELDAAPREFVQPRHYDADVVAFVKGGEGVVVVLLRGDGEGKGRRESFCVREGDVVVIPAGAVVYSVNTHTSAWLRFVLLLRPVASKSGRFQEFFPIGGKNQESFLGVFSDDVIAASFNTSREEWEKVFKRQSSQGSQSANTRASEEQIRELISRSCSQGGGNNTGSPSSKCSLTGKSPTYSNSHGKHYQITGDDCPDLRLVNNVQVGLSTIYRGSMIALSYSNRATAIAIVVDGKGYFEMAVGTNQEEEEQGGGGGGGGGHCKCYSQVKSRVREGSVIVIPAGHPAVLVAGKDENVTVLSFQVTNDNFLSIQPAGPSPRTGKSRDYSPEDGQTYYRNQFEGTVFLAGTNGVLLQLRGSARVLAFGAMEEAEVDLVIGAQKDAVFLRSRGVSSRVFSTANRPVTELWFTGPVNR